MDSPPPPFVQQPPREPEQRYGPYRRQQPAEANRPDPNRANYHWFTMCALRNNIVSTYDDLYAVHAQLREAKPVSERQIAHVLNRLADYITCGGCGQMIARLDHGSFVAKCGHVYHKSPVNCWAQANSACTICIREPR